MNLVEVIKRPNPVARGFVNYFSIANCKRVLEALTRWVRRRLRAIELRLWKNSVRLHKRLKQLGKSCHLIHQNELMAKFSKPIIEYSDAKPML
ncbi:group II intron maturase-specific domain-containing protein [Pseudoalteromonas sp.]|uniref:group II intron maturase-specific domain-containing protein n=1 Tax=Pseudoalteromonas sp. TaxID=53249 RepID=UPI00344B5DD2